jgi:hypothetical protein
MTGKGSPAERFLWGLDICSAVEGTRPGTLTVVAKL